LTAELVVFEPSMRLSNRLSSPVLGLLLLASQAACQHAQTGDGNGAALDESENAAVVQQDFPGGTPLLCARQADDAVRDVFCGGEQARITGFRELAASLKVRVLLPSTDEAAAAAVEIEPHALVDNAVYLGHSTALSGQVVSPINPRAILLGPKTILAFQRGVQQVEIITEDRSSAKLNFYLLSFRQACNKRMGGCRPGDLYTLSVERNWSSVALEDDDDLKNTPFDCRQCHQRGARGPATLLMRELRGPWTHFFGPDPEVETEVEAQADAETYDSTIELYGRGLSQDYIRAKGSESYAGLPGSFLRHTAGLTLQNRVGEGQPLEFDTSAILADFIDMDPGARRSKTWDDAYAAFKRGEQLPLPHFEPRPTDPEKQAALADAYARYRAGELHQDELPDLADIFPDDPQTRAEIGLQTEPDATPAEALIQACGACHNDVLDQSLSRARFNIALSRMSRAELDLAIKRIQISQTRPFVMPPAGTRQLDAEGKKRLIAYLKQKSRSAQDDALLEHAAKNGMAKEPDYIRGSIF
jgi:hypothetical protein